MFRATAFTDTPRVSSYDDAVAALHNRQRLGKPHPVFPDVVSIANNSKNTMWVRRDAETGDIRFRLHDTDVVVWHPDNSVTIENYGSASTSAFGPRRSSSEVMASRV